MLDHDPMGAASPSGDQPDPRLTAALVGRYRIEREIGRGGMAAVYAAEDVKHSRRVAIKIVDPAVSVALGHERFLREIRLAASLQHPNILSVYDSGEAGDLLYYVMPLIDGPSLRARLAKERQLPVDEAIRITTQVASALAYAHAHGIVHRDIKPENILLDGDRPLVADFGIAKSLDVAAESLTATGNAVGTPAYMSPEQSTGERVDARSDIYSLGCVLYEMLAGEPPFTGVSAQALIAKRLTAPTPSVRVVRESVSLGVDRAIGRALARVPADRFATADDFAHALEAGAEPTPRSRSIGSLPAFAAGIVLVVSLGVLWTQRPGARTSGGARTSHDTALANLITRARTQADRRSAEALQRGIALYRQAIARDSNSADAWAGLARALVFARAWRYPVPGVPVDSILPLVMRAGNRAIEADSGNVEAWLAQAQVMRVVDPTAVAPRLEALQRALRIDSTNAETWYELGNVWMDSLEMRRSIDAHWRAVKLRPTYRNALAFLAYNYLWLRNNDSALVWADSAKRVDPSQIFMRQTMSLVRRERHEWEAARDEYSAVIRIGHGPDQVYGWSGLAELAWRNGDRHAADTLIARAVALADTLHPSVHDAAYIAWGLAETNQRERALGLLERCEPRFDAHFQLHLQRDPTLDKLRSEPRFRAMLRRPDPGR
jgi:serine/threonine protein kinase/tetratricopeptide (TPR) repeat protein